MHADTIHYLKPGNTETWCGAPITKGSWHWLQRPESKKGWSNVCHPCWDIVTQPVWKREEEKEVA